MEQYRNLSSAMEAGNHSKNRTCLKNQKSKGNVLKIFLAICLIVYGFNVSAQNKITFTWQAAGEKSIRISAKRHGETFTVNWGDGTIESMTAAGDYRTISHTYSTIRREYVVIIATESNDCTFTHFDCAGSEAANNQISSLNVTECPSLEYLDCGDNQLTELDLSNCSKLWGLDCRSNRLTELDLSRCSDLKDLYCQWNQLTVLKLHNYNMRNIWCNRNRLQLSDLYVAHLKTTVKENKGLGRQDLLPQTIVQGGMVDFSAQRIFEGISTVFEVEKSGVTATKGVDYNINNGIITFINTGKYNVEMTNAVLVSDFPAYVIAEINVGGTNSITDVSSLNFSIYPNPTSDKFIIDYENCCQIKLYDMLGKEILTQNAKGKTEINIRHLPKGIYNVKVFSEDRVVGNSKIVKQ